MNEPSYISVRRPAGTPFGVLSADLSSEIPSGYDLTLMRDLTIHGLAKAISVESVADGSFRVLNGRKRLAAIRLLVRANKMVYDRIRGFMRPASQVFALVRCRLHERRTTSPSGVVTVPSPGPARGDGSSSLGGGGRGTS